MGIHHNSTLTHISDLKCLRYSRCSRLKESFIPMGVSQAKILKSHFRELKIVKFILEKIMKISCTLDQTKLAGVLSFIKFGPSFFSIIPNT